MNYAQLLLQFLAMMQTVTPAVTATIAQVEQTYDAIINHPDHPAGATLPTIVPAAPAAPAAAAS